MARLSTWERIVSGISPSAEVCEVGAGDARFAEHILSSCSNVYTYTAVDRWARPGGYEDAATRLAPFGGRVRILRTRSTDAALQVPDSSLDVVFLRGGDRTPRGFVTDLVAWWPKVRPGGILGGGGFWEGSAHTAVTAAVLGFADGVPGACLVHNATEYAIVKPPV